MTSPAPLCPACLAREGFESFQAREMLFGTRETFTYRECAQCGSLHIAEIPVDLARHYPSDYYSLIAPPKRNATVPALRKAWIRWLVSGGAAAGWMAARMTRKYPFFHWARLTRVNLDSAVLDLGCGSGGLLRRMQRYGFSNLAGVDPYTSIEADEPGFRVKRAELTDVKEQYDLIMLHHVLEHLPDARKSLEEARVRLRPGGRILVRIPAAASDAYQTYREHWFHLDPPRHLLVPSRRGMEILAERAGLRVMYTEFDGTETGYLMSEYYRRDIPYVSKPRDNPDECRRWRKRAEEANRRGEGDQGVFVLEVA